MKYWNSKLSLARQCSPLLTLLLLLTAGDLYAQGTCPHAPEGAQPRSDKHSTLSATKQSDYEIPVVSKRPFDTVDGPKLSVEHFKLEGADAFENSAISQQTLNRMLEDIRKSQPEGFTVGELQQVANQVTQYYRQKGFILAQAFVPAQTIQNNTIVISVLSGKLGQTTPYGNDHYSSELMTWHFAHLADQAVQAKVMESALLRLNDTPGLEASGVFRPGQNVGETELVLNAKAEKPLDFVLIADNHGVETTGTSRLIGSLNWNNPTGNGDQMTITVLQTFDPDDSTNGAISYKLPIFIPAFSVGLSYNSNNYVIGQSTAAPDIDGKTEIASLNTSYSFVRSRTLNVSGTLDFSRKWAEVKFKDFDVNLGEDHLSVFSTTVNFDVIDGILGGDITEGSLALHKGLADFAGSMDSNGDNNSLRTGNSGEYAGGDFDKISFDITRLQLINSSNTVLIRLKGQHSDDLLSSIEQFAMGGPNSVRAYPVSEYIHDKAIFTSIEWIINAPGFSNKPAFAGRNWGEVFQISFFVDYAKGVNNDPKIFNNPLIPDEKKKEHISGAGIGLALNLTDTFFIRAEAATPISHQDASNGDNPQYWLSAGFEF